MELAGPMNNWHYYKRLQPFAHKLRNEIKVAESYIWKIVLSRRQLMGYQFRRQRPILNYIADFMSKDLMLVIEVDGISHIFDYVAEKDALKEQNLNKIGFTVLRFTDNEVINDLIQVIQDL